MPPDSATTLLSKVPALLPAVNLPVASMVPPPAATFQVKVSPAISLPAESRPRALNCWASPALSWALTGETSTVTSLPAAISTVAVPARPSADASIVPV